MFHPPETRRPAPGMTYDQMLETVRYEGAYPTRERAAEAVRNVLGAFGRQITDDERVALAACLPDEAARHLVSRVPAAEPVTGWAFVKNLAAETGNSPAVTRWETGAVFAVVARLADPSPLARILDRLPEGWPLLFGQARLLSRAAA
ncbi:DUF2267 domain-containing protein [Streptomyces sp. RerS4]|uniref:DUF2267 domain-containing protein n=1 Tax=Streptomyces sp. RerS4 TaxID=2942449 RepID=UPI00201C7BF5|nr:DUF2267 domain-containing protein [Streptomyces sp. RerS4]UQX03771.1 DUF2267 domain-containing protein [Streptomyces sp. RerS4]